MDWTVQRYWDDVNEQDELPTVSFPISVYRLVVEAGANRDFNSIHHNTEFAQASGAPDMYANNIFIQGMWERAVREYIGLDGTFRKIGPFRIRTFMTVGETVTVTGRVQDKRVEAGEKLVEIALRSTVSSGIAVEGTVLVALPSKSAK